MTLRMALPYFSIISAGITMLSCTTARDGMAPSQSTEKRKRRLAVGEVHLEAAEDQRVVDAGQQRGHLGAGVLVAVQIDRGEDEILVVAKVDQKAGALELVFEAHARTDQLTLFVERIFPIVVVQESGDCVVNCFGIRAC